MKSIIIGLGVLVALAGCTPDYADPNPERAYKGNKDALVVVEEFSDFQCPACGQAFPVLKQLAEKYGDQLYFKYYHFPLTSIHPYAFNASMAAECANDQGKFWEYHDTLFENQTDMKRSDLAKYADQVGLDTELFDACFKSRAKSDLVTSDMKLGNSRNVRSTPSIYVNGELLSNWSSLGSVIESVITLNEESKVEDEGSEDN